METESFFKGFCVGFIICTFFNLGMYYNISRRMRNCLCNRNNRNNNELEVEQNLPNPSPISPIPPVVSPAPEPGITTPNLGGVV
jgi:hypothetical protein